MSDYRDKLKLALQPAPRPAPAQPDKAASSPAATVKERSSAPPAVPVPLLPVGFGTNLVQPAPAPKPGAPPTPAGTPLVPLGPAEQAHASAHPFQPTQFATVAQQLGLANGGRATVLGTQPTSVMPLVAPLQAIALANAGPASTPHPRQPTMANGSPPKVTPIGAAQPWMDDPPLHGAPGATGSRPPGAGHPPKSNSAAPRGGGTSRPPRSDDIALHGRPGGPGATGTGGAVGTQPTAANPGSAPTAGGPPSGQAPPGSAAGGPKRHLASVAIDPIPAAILGPVHFAQRRASKSAWDTSSEREAYAYAFFKKHLGLKDFQAAALVGNLSKESYDTTSRQRLLPALHEKAGHGIGIAQWTSQARKDSLFAFAEAVGSSVMTLKGEAKWENFGVQLAFVAYELVSKGRGYGSTNPDSKNPGYLAPADTLTALKQSTSLSEAVALIQLAYEQPGGSDGRDLLRVPKSPLLEQFPHGHELQAVAPIIYQGQTVQPSYNERLAFASNVLEAARMTRAITTFSRAFP